MICNCWSLGFSSNSMRQCLKSATLASDPTYRSGLVGLMRTQAPASLPSQMASGKRSSQRDWFMNVPLADGNHLPRSSSCRASLVMQIQSVGKKTVSRNFLVASYPVSSVLGAAGVGNERTMNLPVGDTHDGRRTLTSPIRWPAGLSCGFLMASSILCSSSRVLHGGTHFALYSPSSQSASILLSEKPCTSATATV